MISVCNHSSPSDELRTLAPGVTLNREVIQRMGAYPQKNIEQSLGLAGNRLSI
jgi:hypothetical protein